MRVLKTINPLLWRVMVFFGIFLLASGVIGPRIISGGILFSGGFAIYGGIGKALIFSAIAFAILVRRSKSTLQIQPWEPKSLVWIVASALSFWLTWLNVDYLLASPHNPSHIILAHGSLLAGVVFACIGSIGPSNICGLWRAYKHELLISGAIAITFYWFLQAVYALWRPLASMVLQCVNALLGASGLHAAIFSSNTLVFDKFGITVAEYCSGIESIALFTGLYIIVGLLDWNKLNKRRFISIFPFALLVLCLLNVVRVYVLIMAGYYINPAIAFSLFHTYAGLVFFIVYSAVFWAILYKYMLKKHHKKEVHSEKANRLGGSSR
jgi:exosortase/archaeosortase family protein